MSTDRAIERYIEKATPEQKEILYQIRNLVFQTVPDAKEAIKWGIVVFGKAKDFAYLRHAKKHITLGFYRPQVLTDSDGLLEGSGKVMKHLKIKTKEDIRTDLFAEWFTTLASS